MKISLGEKLKTLRKEKNISQEKLASFLDVSYQAVSKWENDITCPDIFLLPEIARFFDITVDELLQVEKIDEAKLKPAVLNFMKTVIKKKHLLFGRRRINKCPTM